MCGIAGIAGKNTKRYQQQVKQMTDRISHRGPDGDAMSAFENCVLGHRRLSIIDLSTGDQPMHSPHGASIIFNGEFYGFLDIKKQLKYNWQTSSDTEVILALYHQYGADEFIKLVRGMFAFAIWDEKEQQLIAARDRFGEKPFYYAITKENELVFASEIKAILASGLVEPEISTEALSHYLQHLYVHPHHSIYKNIFVLPPAHSLLYKEGILTIQRYWDLPQKHLRISKTEAKEECYRLLQKAVKEQLIADVPVGCFLSGGLDSSTITALASMAADHPLTTISFSFGTDKSELPYSRQIAAKYKTNNVELQQDDFNIAQWFEKMVCIYDEPFADSSNIPTYLISQMAARQFKVVLTGDGGDELMAGYRGWYRSLYQMQHPGNWKGGMKNLTKKILYPKYRNGSIAAMHVRQNVYFSKNELDALVKSDTSYSFDKFLSQPYNSVDAAMRMDILDYMPGDILVKTDRAAMANSLELRTPFLDVDFAEFCIALPEEYKINQKEEKVLLKESFKHLWTDDICNRSKQGFGAPVEQWLLQQRMQQLKKEYLFNSSNKVYEWLDPKIVNQYAAKNNYQTWILLTLAIWMQRHL
ncbi:MAG TPA: asparagine synthase (glutamine-hydrolyzing) [Chitinophagaceae bacterium]